jgi:PDZ domain-containing protein
LFYAGEKVVAMTQRNLAGLLAVPLLIALWVVALTQPLPYVTFQPGVTINVLGDFDGRQIIQVSGHKTYDADGQLRMTTVLVSRPRPTRVNLVELMAAWISRDDAVYPYRIQYPTGTTQESNEKEGKAEMVSSQHLAAAAALDELGYDVTEAHVADVTRGTPAEGNLEKDDVILSVNGTDVANQVDVVNAVQATPDGDDISLVVRRDGHKRTVTVTPEVKDGQPFLGIQLSTAVLPLPFDVKFDMDPNIGGPSAGLMFSLGVYDTLTPGSLTGGRVVAGTGTIDEYGAVGPIGGIAQKIAGARNADADLFLVPPANCPEALNARNGDMELVRADTMHDATSAIETWVKNPDAKLPSCQEVKAG